VPLLKTRWLCKKANKRVLLTMELKADRSGVVFGVQADVAVKGGNAAQKREHDKRIGVGTMSRAGAKCPCCDTIMTMEDLRVAGKSQRLGLVPTAVVSNGLRGREYRLPTDLERRLASIDAPSDIADVFEEVPFGAPAEPLPGETGLGMRMPKYGFTKWRELFTPRQLLSLGVFVRSTRAARRTACEQQQQGTDEWAESILAYLALALDRLADRNSMLCWWQTTAEKVASTFTRFALPMTWDCNEINPFADSSGGYLQAVEWESKYLEHALDIGSTQPPHVQCLSAIAQAKGEPVDLILTDPPYYDAIPYSDLMDFFYLWLRRTLDGTASDIERVFGSSLSPKWSAVDNDGELIDDSSRHKGNIAKSKASYEEGMARAFQACCRSLRPDGRLVVVFAHKHPDAWETLVAAIIRSGFVVDASWPIMTERTSRMRSMGSAALSSSVWLVCRKRPATARPGWDNAVLDEMRDNIKTTLCDFWDSGIRGPDFVWSATGPALEAYSKHPVVKKANEPGPMTVSEFLTHVRRMVVDFVVGRVLSGGPHPGPLPKGEGGADDAAADRLDEPTSYYLLHRHDFGFGEAPAGTCILYAVSCGLSDRELVDNWNLLSKSGGSTAMANGNDVDPDSEAEADEGSGSKLKLKTWAQRKNRTMGYEAPGGRPVPLVDQVHRLMHLWRGGDVHKVDEYLDDHGLRRQELFWRLLQSLIELSEPGSDERSILESLSNHIGAKGAKKKEPKYVPMPFGDDE